MVSAILLFGLVGTGAPVDQYNHVIEDGQAQVVPAFADEEDWILERLWVQADFDSDQDGKKDRLHVDVTRPRQTEDGLKVPVIYESSPYFAGTAGGRSILWDVRHEVGAEPPARTVQPKIPYNPNRTRVSNSQVNAWVPRGFAVVHSDAPGTGLSDGSPTVGGPAERHAPKAVIDWLNGRAEGYTERVGGERVFASWCTGKVGMTGTSYNGTIPVAAATTGVEGLEAIIPVAPNTSYYHYYRSHGLVRHPGGWLGEDIDSLYDFINSGDPAARVRSDRLYRNGEFVRGRDRKTGDFNDFWEGRDLLTYVDGIQCAVMMSHAFNDWNVVPEHSVRISEALKGRVPLVQYFHQGGHGGPPPMELMNKWFTRFLLGVENGIEDGPKSYIERGNRRGNPTAYADYPHPDAQMVTYRPSGDGSSIGVLSRAQGSGRQSFTDNVEFDAASLARAESSPHRLLFATEPLTEEIHISGTPRIMVRLASSKPAANFSAYLVALPVGEGNFVRDGLITRGWADPQNHASLTSGGTYLSKVPGVPLRPGQFVDMTFDLQPDDQIIPAGKRLALMILSSDRDFTLWPAPGTRLTVDLDATQIEIPVVGGALRYSSSL